MTALRPDIDPDGLLEFSVVFTDRSLNHMSKAFQQVMRDLSAGLRGVYNADAVAAIPGGGTCAMEAVARQFGTGARALVLRNGWFSYRWSQIFDAGAVTADAVVMKARQTGNDSRAPSALAPVEEVTARIRAEKPDVVFAPHVETSAGVILPDDYIAALVDSAKPYLENGYDRLQFSFHGIPERHVRKSDPSHAHCLTENCCARAHPCHATCYRHQCFETVRHFVARADIPEGRHGTSFQSRLGREPWLTPFTDQTLRQLPREGVKRLLIICPAFITDCLETLEEINAEGREIFLEAGGESFEQIPCLNDSDGFIKWMKGRVTGWAATL